MTSKKKPTTKLSTPLKKVQKDTIYVDVDDDITSLINEVKKSESSIIAIVLPKNAQLLQGVVNMKLLKRSAARHKKNIALITTDSSVQTLAGVAGVHVAETATSKPFIPTVTIEDVELDENNPVVRMGDESSESTKSSSDESEMLADDTTAEEGEKASTATSVTSKNKKFKVPDFGSFQTRLFLGVGGLIVLIVLWFIGFVVMPKATIVVQTSTQNVPVSDSITLEYDEGATVDTEENILPARRAVTEKTSEATVDATGEKNVGEKASGEVTMSAKVCGAISTPSDVPAGTGVSSGGKTYITQEDASFSFSSFDGACLNFQGDTVGIVAQDSGEDFNLTDDSDFTVSGRSDVNAVGQASGGTTELVTVVSDEDIESAKQSIGNEARGEALQELKQELLLEGFTAMDITLTIGEPVYTITPKEGEEAESVTVKQTVEYELSGYRMEDINTLIDAALQREISEENESKNISDNGSSAVTFEEVSEKEYRFSTVATIGPSLDETALKEEFVGKKRGEIIDRLESIDGVVSAEVTYSPMWITTTPKSAKKIIIEVQSQ